LHLSGFFNIKFFTLLLNCNKKIKIFILKMIYV